MLPKPLKKPAVITNCRTPRLAESRSRSVFSFDACGRYCGHRSTFLSGHGQLFRAIIFGRIASGYISDLSMNGSWMRVKGRQRLASEFATTFILLLVLLPAGFVLSIAAAQGTIFIRKIASGGIKQPLEQILDVPLA